MGDEPRRSGRATKGQNPKILDQSAPIPKKAKKQTAKRESNRVSPDPDEDAEAIIRCICGYNVEDNDDERMMICCDQCSSWQHNECMEVPEDEDELPDKYLCEICDAESHKDLLAKVARGEKPWEERAKERERQEQEKRDRKKKGGKKGKGVKKARTSEVKSKAGEIVNDESTVVAEEAEPVAAVTPQNVPSEPNSKIGDAKDNADALKPKSDDIKSTEPVQVKPTQESESSGTNKRKTRSQSRGQLGHSPGPDAGNKRVKESDQVESTQGNEPSGTNKRKARGESANGRATDAGKEPAAKVRKRSVSRAKETKSPVLPRGGKSAAKREPKIKEINQTELVNSVDELKNDVRRQSTQALINAIAVLIPKVESEDTYQVPESTTALDVAARIGLEVEHAVHLNYSNVPGDPTTDYRHKLRSILFNLKENLDLLKGLLQGTLSPNKFSTMSSEEMASKELQERNAEMLKEVEKQHILIKEEGPRIRRTHKGEELVGGDQMDGTSDSVPTARPVRPRRESGVEQDSPTVKSPSGSAMSPTTPFSSLSFPEGRRESLTGRAGSPTVIQSTNDEANTTASAAETAASALKPTSGPVPFNIQDVWSSVQSQGGEKKQRPTLQALQTTSGEVVQAEHANAAGIDPEIDQLLKDEEMESPPYSPTDYASDPTIIWRGKVGMFGVAEFFASAKHAAGPNLNHVVPWSDLLPNHVRVDFRIPAERANRYLCELRYSRTTDIIVVGLSPTGGSEGQAEFDKMWQHFQTRQKYGVISNNTSPAVRDVYVIPLEAGTTELPVFMEMLQDVYLEKPRPERLILITYVLKSPPRQAFPPQTPATPSAAHGASAIAPATNPGEAGHDTSIVSAVGPAASPITPHPAQGNSSMTLPPQHATPVSSSNAMAAEQILGPFINASVVRQLLSQSPGMGPVQLTVIRQILDKVPEAGEDFVLLTRLLMEKSHAEGV